MYEVLKKGRLHNLSIKSQYDLFDKIVKWVRNMGVRQHRYYWKNALKILQINIEFEEVNSEFYVIWRTWHLSYVSLYRTTHD